MLKDELPKIVTDAVPGSKAAAVLARRAKAIPSAIRTVYPVVMDKAQGAIIQDVDGNKFLDFIGGVGVLNIGHCHPEVVEAVKAQADKYFHGMFNVVTHEGYVALAEKLNTIVPVKGDVKRTYFANSGAEANENALKLASFYNGRTRVISFSKAFHGRTSLAVEVTNNPKIIAPINNCGHVTYLPLNDIEAMKAELSKGDVCAVIIEGIQGVGGIQLPTDEFMQALRQTCTEHNTVLILDEIQSGYGRSGKFFAH